VYEAMHPTKLHYDLIKIKPFGERTRAVLKYNGMDSSAFLL